MKVGFKMKAETMMSKQMKTYTLEFKQQAIKLAQQEGMSISQAARDLGISQAGLNRARRSGGKSYRFSRSL
jgi:transposase-like protein